jgi:hypothetical protein
MGVIDLYQVDLCRRGRCEQQDARFVATGDADEAAYKVTGEHLHSEGERDGIGPILLLEPVLEPECA